jgi:hypothetical protein
MHHFIILAIILMLHLIMASGWFKPPPYQEHASLLVLLLCICLTPSSKDASFHNPSYYPHDASHHGFWLVQAIPLSGACIIASTAAVHLPDTK